MKTNNRKSVEVLLVFSSYTSHEHLFEVGLIHMNGRLYAPLLRRFLNADEHIQDPYNTQNYNKYGYVYNNPLMYNDPSGEFAFLAPIFAWVAANAVAIGTASAISAVFAGLIYTIDASINNSWTLGGFAKAVFGGALTGAVSGALGQVFSAGGFWATVGNGTLAGAGGGGINALINGQNFLEGLVKGAVIGGVMGAISYTIKFFTSNNTENLTEADLNLSDIDYANTPNPSSNPETLNNRINTFRKNNYSTSEIKQFGISSEKVDLSSINSENGLIDGNVIAFTRRNFFTNTSSITYSAKAANSPYLLGKTMAHETAHAYANKLTRLIPFSGNNIKTGLQDSRLDTIEHIAIKKLENVYYRINLNGINMKELNIIPSNSVNNIIRGLSPFMQNQVNSWYDKFFNIFNRRVTYKGILW